MDEHDFEDITETREKLMRVLREKTLAKGDPSATLPEGIDRVFFRYMWRRMEDNQAADELYGDTGNCEHTSGVLECFSHETPSDEIATMILLGVMLCNLDPEMGKRIIKDCGIEGGAYWKFPKEFLETMRELVEKRDKLNLPESDSALRAAQHWLGVDDGS